MLHAAEKLSGVYVDAIRPHTGLLEAHRELELIDHVAAAEGTAKRLEVLADEAPRVLRVGGARWIRLTDSGPKRIVGSTDAGNTGGGNAVAAIDHAEALDDTEDWVPQVWRDMDTTLAAAPIGDPAPPSCWAAPGGPGFGRRRWHGWATWLGSSPRSCADEKALP